MRVSFIAPGGATAALALVMAAPADAQSSTGAPASPAPEAAPGRAAEQGQGVMQEIVVTAQRRSEKLQDVPIAVTAITPATAKLFGTTSTDTLANSVPSLQFPRQSGVGVNPILRGIGSSESVGAESEVAVYIDDVYVGNSSAIDFQFNNIAAVEVLKGPQGTLFGRNANGGVIQIRTRQPTHEAAADAQIGYASYDTIYGNLYVNGGLTDTLAANFSATGRNQGRGYGRSLVTGNDTLRGWNYAFRGKLLWEPSSSTRLVLTGDYNNQYDEAGGNVVIAPGTLAVGGGTAPADKFGTYAAPNDFQTNRLWRVSGRLTQDVGKMKLVAITAYTDTKQHFVLDLDGSPTGAPIITADAHVPGHAFSQELQLQSPTEGRFRYILGAFYYNSYYALYPQRLIGTSQTANGGYRDLFSSLDLSSYSGFADGTFEITPDTNFTAGIRYTSDQYSSKIRVVNANGVTLPPTRPEESKTFSKPTWRFVLDHHFTRDIMGYASYSRGFKAGRFNPSDGLPIDPETLDAYEVGLKTELFDRKVRFNLAAFHYNYKKIQVTITQFGLSQVRNAGAAKINGADMDLTFAPSRRLNIVAGVSILDAKYSSFPNGPSNIQNPAYCGGAAGPPGTTGPLTPGMTTCTVDLKGNRLPRAPKFVGNLAVTYTLPTSIGDFDLNGTIYHNSGFFWEPDDQYRQPKYDLLSAGVTWRSLDKKYELRVYGKNLLNEYYYNFFSSGSLRAAGSPAMPDNYGAELTVHF